MLHKSCTETPNNNNANLLLLLLALLELHRSNKVPFLLKTEIQINSATHRVISNQETSFETIRIALWCMKPNPAVLRTSKPNTSVFQPVLKKKQNKSYKETIKKPIS